MIRRTDDRCWRVELPDGSLAKGRFHTEAEAREHADVLLAQRVLASMPYVRPHDAALEAFRRSFHWRAQYVRVPEVTA